MSAYELIAHIFGITYFVTWSLSFYPQAWENYKRKDVQGLSFEFVFLHPFAYFFYCIYTYSGRINPFMATGVVSIDDMLFSTHGLLLTSLHLT